MDPYAEVCKRFEDQHIRYLVVGVFGINFYARQAGQIITTPADRPKNRLFLEQHSEIIGSLLRRRKRGQWK